MEDRTVVIVTSDYGGVNKGHRSITLAEIGILFIFGRGIRKGGELTQRIMTFKTADAILCYFG